MTSILQLNNLGRRFDQQWVFHGLSASIAPGEIVALVGKNGAGKTTLLETLIGLSLPDAGEVSIFGCQSSKIGAKEKARIGFVPQEDELLASINAREHIRLWQQFHHHWDQALSDRLLDEWEIPASRSIKDLSVGQRQKLAIILAIGHRPELLILDEPVASLDPLARRAFLNQIIELSLENQCAVLFSSHIVSDLERVAQRIWLLKDKVLQWQDSLDALKESVVRLHIQSSQALPAQLNIEHCLQQKVRGKSASVSVAHWHADKLPALAQQLQAEIRVEQLPLEELLMELL